MTTLVLCTAYSDLLVDVIIRELARKHGDVVVVDTDDSVHAKLKATSISSLPIRADSNMGWSERDEAFRELAMPGEQLGIPFPSTELPIWKVLGTDRLMFWYRGDMATRLYEYCRALRWDSLIASADLAHPLPWTLARETSVTGVQVGSFRTREWYDLLSCGGVRFESMIVKGLGDGAILQKLGYGRVVSSC